MEGCGDVFVHQMKSHVAPQLAIPKSPNKPHGPGSSPKGARAGLMSRSPSIQELLFAEEDDDDGDGTRVRSSVTLNSSSKESLTTSPSKEGLKGCACSRTHLRHLPLGCQKMRIAPFGGRLSAW